MTPTTRPTLKSVAAAAGVSVSTVSRALADNLAVAPATRTRIQRLAAELGYRPNAQARALKGARSNVIGVVVPSLTNHYFASMVEYAQRTAAEHGLLTLVISSQESPAALDEALAVLTDHQVDGILCVPHEDSAARLLATRQAGTPVVLVDRELPGTDMPTVVSDPWPGMSAAVSRLADRGTSPIGYLSGPMSTSTGRARLATFRRACVAAGLPEQPVYLGGYEQVAGLRGAEQLLDSGVRALFAGDSMMTIGVIEACHRRGVSVGQQVAVVGFDRQPMFALQPRPLTVVDQRIDVLVQSAMDMLLAQIAGESVPTGPVAIPTRLVDGESIEEV